MPSSWRSIVCTMTLGFRINKERNDEKSRRELLVWYGRAYCFLSLQGWMIILSMGKMILKLRISPGLRGSVGWSIVSYTERRRVRFLVRAHSHVAGSVPTWEATCRCCARISMSLIFRLSKINKKQIYPWMRVKNLFQVCILIFTAAKCRAVAKYPRVGILLMQGQLSCHL